MAYLPMTQDGMKFMSSSFSNEILYFFTGNNSNIL